MRRFAAATFQQGSYFNKSLFHLLLLSIKQKQVNNPWIYFEILLKE